MAETDSRRSHRRYVILLILVGLMVAGWSGLWYYAAGKAQETIEAWLAREAKAGRIFTCGSENSGGYPFRIEVGCDDATALFQTLQPAVELKTTRVLAAAQIYQPNLLIAVIEGPLTMAEAGQPASLSASWKLGQASVRGTPAEPERVSLVFDEPSIERMAGAGRETLLKASHIELHGRIAEGSVAERPVVEAVLQVEGASAPVFHPATADPIDANAVATLHGLQDFAPKPWPARFREIQAAGGRIEIARLRLRQGEILAVGNGTLSLNASGQLEGQLRVTVAGLEQFLEKIGAQHIVQKSPQMDRVAGMLDRLSPGLGQAARQHASTNISAGLNWLGEQTTLEGKRALTLPLRFSEGAAFLGPIRIGNAPVLF